MQTTSFTVGPLRGMDQRWKPQADTGYIVQDMSWEVRDAWRTAGGYRRLVLGDPAGGGTYTNPYAGQGQVPSLHFFSQHNGARSWIIYETGTPASGASLFAFDPSVRGAGARRRYPLVYSNGTAVTGRKMLATPWQRTQSVAWGGRMYFVNGYDVPLVFNGEYVERAGFDVPPTAPQAQPLGNMANEDSTGAGTGIHMAADLSPVYTFDPAAVAPGTKTYDYRLDIGLGPILTTDGDVQKCGYRYKVTYVNERGQESPASAASSLVQFINKGGDASGNAATPVFVVLPRGGDHVVARRLYRTQNVFDAAGNLLNLGYGEAYYFHSEISDNFVTTFEDVLPDSFLGALLDENALGPWPFGVKYVASFKDTLFVAGGTANEVRFSAPRFPEVFPPDNVMDIGDADLGPVTGLYATRNAVVVFKPRGIYLIKGDPVNGFYAITLTKDVGCQSPNSVVEIPGVGLCFLSEDGIYALSGSLENEGVQTRVAMISDPVTEWIHRVNRSALSNACAAVYHRDREVWWALPTLGNEYPDLVLIFHYEGGAWSHRDNFPIYCMAETHDARGYLVFGSYDDTSHPGLHVYSRGWPDKDGVAIEPYYQSNPIDLGRLYRSFQPKHIMVYAVGQGDNPLTLNYTVNRSLDFVRETAQSTPQQDPNEEFAVYGTGVWGTSRWGKLRQIVMRFDVNTQKKGPVHELSVTFAPQGRHFQIFGYDVEAAVGEQMNIKPLNRAVGPSTR